MSMQVNIFSCLKDKTPKDTTLDNVVRIMRSSELLRQLCERRKELLKDGNKIEADIIKKGKIPAFAPCVLLYGGKRREDVLGLTDLCFLDFDHITDDEIERSISILSNDSHVVLAARSISSDGLHVLIRYSFKDMEYPRIGMMSQVRMNFVYGCVYRTMGMYYGELLSVKADKQGGNMERLCTISFDENLYYNNNAEPIVLEFEKRKVNKRHRPYNILNV